MTLREAFEQKILLLDGGMGSVIQTYGIKGANNDMLSIEKPDVILDIQRRYVAAGVDVLTANTFSSQRISQREYHQENRIAEMNRAAVKIAKQAASDAKDRPVFVLGDVGPTSKMLSMSEDVNDPASRSITFDELEAAYYEQIDVLVDAGVDAILIETTVAENDLKPFEPYAGLRFESQFTKSYTYDDDDVKTAVSCFMDPAYFTQMLGVAYVPNDNFRQSLAFANRLTISEGYGYADDKDTKKFEKYKDEPGLESVTEYKAALSSLASFRTRLWAFVNFHGVDEIDGKWENYLDVTIAPLIVLSVGVEVAYDKDIDEDSQYHDSVNLGITWRWF